MTTTEVENFPGFAEGVQGPQLMDDMRTQAERFGAELVARDVTEVDLTATPKIVEVGDEVHRAHAVIVATGASTATSAWTTRPGCSAAASRPVRPVTGSSSATRTSWSSAAATRRWRRPPSSPASPRA